MLVDKKERTEDMIARLNSAIINIQDENAINVYEFCVLMESMKMILKNQEEIKAGMGLNKPKHVTNINIPNRCCCD